MVDYLPILAHQEQPGFRAQTPFLHCRDRLELFKGVAVDLDVHRVDLVAELVGQTPEHIHTWTAYGGLAEAGCGEQDQARFAVADRLVDRELIQTWVGTGRRSDRSEVLDIG